MRKLEVLLAMVGVASVMGLTGCEEKPELPAGSGGLGKIQIDFLEADRCGSSTCGYDYAVSFHDSAATGQYYYYRIVVWRHVDEQHPDEEYIIGPDKLFLNSNHQITMHIRIPYYAGLSEYNHYHLDVRRDQYPVPVSTIWAQRRAQDSVYLSSFASDCASKCCSAGRWYAGIRQYATPPATFFGADADIMVRECRPCGANAGLTTRTASCAHVSVAHDTLGFRDYNCAWAQVGYFTIRFADGSETYTVSYSEMHANPYSDEVAYFDVNELVEGEIHTYRTKLDTLTGQWRSYVDSLTTPFKVHLADTFWLQCYGTRATYTGEIWHHETDMPGDTVYPCLFGHCGVFLSGTGWVKTQFFGDYGAIIQERVDGRGQWFMEIKSRDSIEIGDLVLQP